ncbi:hypothetical protein [Abyssisolibacter fermentans]|uniref:hypothetical protein n=1 Tax=Abyssisolibacter fermentans TaxID=1766203 RepID=UPI000830C123|nr:hypothetical protein [Abyssisolibacter fermentans]
MRNEILEIQTDKYAQFTNELMRSKSHSLIAGIFDFYVLGTVLNIVIALISSILEIYIYDCISLISIVLLFLVSILGIVLYYAIFSKKILWLSPGEKMAGRRIIESKKEWINPYRCNRWALFTIMIISIIIIGNELGENIYPIQTVISKTLSITLQIYGLILLGKGKLKGAIIFIIINLLGFIASLSYQYFTVYSKYLTIYFGILLILYCVVTISYYFGRKKSKR